MRKSTTAATLLVSTAACLIAVSPAASADSYVCLTVDPTPAYEYSDFTGYVFTLSAGRGFRVDGLHGEDNTIIGYYGHGAEHPDHEVWVRAQHLSC